MKDFQISPIRVGIVGMKRGKLFLDYAKLDSNVVVCAICDLDEKSLQDYPPYLYKTKNYRDFIYLDNLDAVYIATPPESHTEISTFFLSQNISVLCEIPACLNSKEADLLKRAVEQTSAIYMMAENYLYIPENLAIHSIIKKGKLGEIIFIEGRYVHDCKNLYLSNGELTWRGKWNTREQLNHYPTHCLGPICRWLDIRKDGRDSITTIKNYKTNSSSLKHFFKIHQVSEKVTQPDIVFSIIHTRNGVFIQIRYDTKTNRPNLKNGYEIQGTLGWIQSGRYDEEEPIVYFSCEKKIIPLRETQEYKYVLQNSLFDFQVYGQNSVNYTMFSEFINSIKTGKSSIPIEDAILWSSPLWN